MITPDIKRGRIPPPVHQKKVTKLPTKYPRHETGPVNHGPIEPFLMPSCIHKKHVVGFHVLQGGDLGVSDFVDMLNDLKWTALCLDCAELHDDSCVAPRM